MQSDHDAVASSVKDIPPGWVKSLSACMDDVAQICMMSHRHAACPIFLQTSTLYEDISPCLAASLHVQLCS